MSVAFPQLACATTVRAVFVGIDRYLYSATPKPEHEDTYNPDAGFKDLHGAAGDVRRIKAALHQAYGYNLDPRTAAGCASRNDVSTTLTDTCATRVAILAALDERIAASAPRDTLIFYFVGHGSQIEDDQFFDQPSGKDDTILPTDARNPDEALLTEILDRELRAIIDRATSRGVNVVTIFDTCNSGTATYASYGSFAKRKTRGGPLPSNRWAESLTVRHSAIRAVAPGIAVVSPVTPGYRVHLAAAADANTAQEAGPADRRNGVFTSALIAAIGKRPDRALDDIFAETETRVRKETGDKQSPWASGELYRSLATAFRGDPPLEARWAFHHFVIRKGYLSGLSQGSRYGVFATTTDAMRPGAKPLVAGKISSLDAFQAELSLERKFRGNPDSKYKLVRIEGDADAARAAGRVQTLLALNTMPALATDPGFCIATVDYDAKTCPYHESEAAIVEVGKPALLSIVNRAERYRNIYVLRIDPNDSVTVVLPLGASNESSMRPAQPLRVNMVMTVPGTYRFVVLTTDIWPIDVRRLAEWGPGNAECTFVIPCITASQGGEGGMDRQTAGWRARVIPVVVR